MTYLLLITLAPSPIPSQIADTLFDIISLGVDAVLCHDEDTCKTLVHVAKCRLVIFPRQVSGQQYEHRQETIDTIVPLPDGGLMVWTKKKDQFLTV